MLSFEELRLSSFCLGEPIEHDLTCSPRHEFGDRGADQVDLELTIQLCCLRIDILDLCFFIQHDHQVVGRGEHCTPECFRTLQLMFSEADTCQRINASDQLTAIDRPR